MLYFFQHTFPWFLLLFILLPDGLAPDLAHDAPLAAQVLVAEAQEGVDHECLVAVPDCVEVDVDMPMYDNKNGMSNIMYVFMVKAILHLMKIVKIEIHIRKKQLYVVTTHGLLKNRRESQESNAYIGTEN